MASVMEWMERTGNREGQRISNWEREGGKEGIGNSVTNKRN